MISSVRANAILKAYNIHNVDEFEVLKIEPDNIKFVHKETGKILDLRY